METFLDDKELQEIIRVKGLLENKGFQEYIAKAMEMYKHKQFLIDSMCLFPLKDADVQILNAHIAERNALGTLLNVKIEMEDSVTSPLGEGVKEYPEDVVKKD